MILKLTRLLPSLTKTPVVVNWDNVQWVQGPTEALSELGTTLMMDNGPEIYVEEDLEFILSKLVGGAS